MFFALVFAGILLLLAVFSIRRQVSSLQRLKREIHLPSDDRSYLRNQAYRRLLTGVLLLGLAGLLAGAYLSGMERRADEIGEKRVAANEEGEKPPVAEEVKDFLRVYSYYWIGILILLFVVISLAIVDLWATRRYAWTQLRRIRTENRTLLERDLALYRQQKINDRMR